MTITTQKLSEYVTQTKIEISIGDHTAASHSFNEYKKNAIKDLYKEVKDIAKETKKVNPGLTIGRGYTKEEIHRLNFKLETEYKREVEEYKNIVLSLPFLENEQVTKIQMNSFTSISNRYGRHGSESYLKFKDVREAVYDLERLKDTLVHEGENLKRIVV